MSFVVLFACFVYVCVCIPFFCVLCLCHNLHGCKYKKKKNLMASHLGCQVLEILWIQCHKIRAIQIKMHDNGFVLHFLENKSLLIYNKIKTMAQIILNWCNSIHQNIGFFFVCFFLCVCFLLIFCLLIFFFA